MSGAGCSITIVHVIDIHPTVYLESQKMLNKIMAKFRGGSKRILGQFKSVAQKSGAAVDAVALEGGAAQSIIDYAQQSGLDMIVMGTGALASCRG